DQYIIERLELYLRCTRRGGGKTRRPDVPAARVAVEQICRVHRRPDRGRELPLGAIGREPRDPRRLAPPPPRGPPPPPPRHPQRPGQPPARLQSGPGRSLPRRAPRPAESARSPPGAATPRAETRPLPRSSSTNSRPA